jgi:hypothetical protein
MRDDSLQVETVTKYQTIDELEIEHLFYDPDTDVPTEETMKLILEKVIQHLDIEKDVITKVQIRATSSEEEEWAINTLKMEVHEDQLRHETEYAVLIIHIGEHIQEVLAIHILHFNLVCLRLPNVKITQEILQHYVGGQFMWKDFIDRSERYAGISAINLGKVTTENDTIDLQFYWAADVERRYEDGDIVTYVEQIFDFGSFPIIIGFGHREYWMEQRVSQNDNTYEVLVFIDYPGGYRYELYPPGDHGLDLSKLPGFKLPN